MITKSTDFSIVAAQLTAWALVVIASDFEAVLTSPALRAAVGVGVSFAIFSAFQLGSSYSSSTRPVRGAFVGRGVYRFIRHPIYLALMFIGLVFFLSRPGLRTGLAYLFLVLVTNARAGLEEQMLEDKYPEYGAYKQTTKRFLPFLL